MTSPLAGLGSNIDVNSLVSQLMAVERVPITTLTAKSSKYQAELSAFGTAKGALSNLQTAANALTDAMTTIPATAASSAATVASATAQSGATPAVYALQVNSLAQAHRIYTGAFASADTVVGSGAIAIDRGSFDGTAFTANASIPAVTITIPANSTLTGIRDAINNASAGVTASIVNDGSGFRLVLGANDTGAAQGMRIRTTDDDGGNTDNSGLSQLAFDPAATAGAGRNMTQARAGSDASFTVDGLPMTRPSNSISDAVANVSFSLTGTGPTNVAVARDTSAMRTALDNLVKTYNSTNGTLKSQSSYDAASQTGGPLNGESSIRDMLSQMRRALTTNYGAVGDAYRTLSSIGVSVQSDGTLAVNDTKYNAAIAANPVAVGKLAGAFSTSLANTLDTAMGTGGSLTARTDGIQASIKRLTNQQAQMEARMTSIEARYRAQFSALDSLMSSMTATSTFLTNQLSTTTK